MYADSLHTSNIPLHRLQKSTLLNEFLIMMEILSFGIRFRFDSVEFYETSFSLGLSSEEIAFLKAFLKKNGDMPFWAFEFEKEDLFARMLKAQVAAIIDYVNREVIDSGDDPFTEESIDWECVHVEFEWPKQLLV